MKLAGGGASELNFTSKFSMTISRGEALSPERKVYLNGVYHIREETFKFQTTFLYTVSMANEVNLPSQEDPPRHIVRDGAILRVHYLETIDLGAGVLRISAEIREGKSKNDLLEFVYSINNGETWQRAPMEFTDNHYFAQVPVESRNPLLWTLATKNQTETMDKPVWNIWVMIPPVCTKEGRHLLSIPSIIAGVATPTGITIEMLSRGEIIHFDKGRVMALANLLSDEEILVRREEHTFGVVLSFFDQFEGPLPVIGLPELLESNFQFLMNLSDQAFSATSFVEETTEEKVAIFDIRLEDTQMKCISWAFAIDVLEARGGREHMVLNLLVNPMYGDLITNLSSEMVPTVRWIRSLIENKSPRENIVTQMEGVRNLVTRIITAQQEIYGKR